MSKADKIFDIAEKLGYEGNTEGSTADAINAVSDALGFDGPHKGRITSALADLYTVVDGGGGGGVELGPLAFVAMVYNEPTVGSKPSTSGGVSEVKIGDTVAVSSGGSGILSPAYAAGLTLSTIPAPVDNVACSVYVVTTDNTGKYVTVTAWDGVVTKRETTLAGEPAWCFDFVMPELEQGEMLHFWYRQASGE